MTGKPTRARFIHRVDIFVRDTEAQDATGSLDPTDGAAIATSIPCLVTDVKAWRRHEFGAELQRKRVWVIFPDAIELGTEHLIVFVSSLGTVRRLIVDNFRDDENAGAMFVAECEEMPQPIP